VRNFFFYSPPASGFAFSYDPTRPSGAEFTEGILIFIQLAALSVAGCLLLNDRSPTLALLVISLPVAAAS
jgi:hypothetical protein